MSVKDALRSTYGIVRTHAASKNFSGLHDEVKHTFGLNNEAITHMVTGFIALAIIVGIGIIILANVQAAMPAVNSTSPYYTLQSTVETTTVSGYGLIVIVLIIVAAAGIMYAVRLISK